MAHVRTVAWLFLIGECMGHVFHGFVHGVVFLSFKVFSEQMSKESLDSLYISLLFEIDNHSYHE